jgi:peptidoglycan hydrolase CwlO-like protein
VGSSPILLAVIAGIPSVIAALFAYRSSMHANKATEDANRLAVSKVEGEAFERSQAFYDRLLANAEKELVRLQAQVDRLNQQLDKTNAELAQEKHVAQGLRVHVATMQAQVVTMETSLESLRAQIQNRPTDNR